MKHIFYFLFVPLLFFVYSCSKNTVFEDNVDIPDGVWKQSNNLVFSFRVDDTNTPYNIFFNISNTQMYANSNLWLFVSTIAPNGKVLKDTFECVLADETGKWYGTGIGDMIDTQIAYRRNVGFPMKGVYSIQIQQGMRTANLPYIMEVGMMIEKAKIEKK